MEVNENYYGLKENWFPLGGTSGSSAWQSQIPEDEKFKLANFLNNTQQKLQSDRRNGIVLGNAIYKAYKTDSTYYDPTFESTLMGKVFDPSIEFAGMAGNYCPYSTIMYYSNRREQDQGSTRELVNEGEEHIDVWNYFYTSYTPVYTQGYGNLVRRWSDFYVAAPSSPSGTSGYEFTAMRWLPGDPQDSPIQIGNPSSSYPYYYTSYATRNDLTFITQFPCRRTVLVPTVSCSDDALNPTNVRTYDLYTYLNQYKETRPIVWSIQVEIYTKAGASDLPTFSDKRVLRNTMMMVSNTPLSLPFRNGSPYVQTMAAGGTLVNTDNPFMAPQIIPTASSQTPIGGPINVGLGASMRRPDWEVTGGNGYNSFSVWAVINCGKLEFNNWTSRIIGGDTACRCYCNAADYTKAEFKEAVRHATACFGMFFTDSEAYAETAQLDDDTMHLGVLDNGVGYGEYTSGEKNTEQPQFGWKTMNESDYDPSNPPTPPQPSLPDNWNDSTNPHYLTASRVLPNHWYLCKETLLKEVFSKLTDIDLTTLDKNLTYGLNPIDCVIQMKRIFFSYSIALEQLTPTQVTDIAIGKKSINIKPEPSNTLVATEYNRPYTFECITGYPVGEPSIYRDFRSYLPYASCAFYDAFCGIIEIDPAKILNKYITITQTVDFLSGDKITSLYASENQQNRGERIATLNGNCSENLPINGVQAADFIRNNYLLMQAKDISIWNTISKSAMGAGGASISGLMGNTIGAATQAIGTIANAEIASINTETINYQLQHSTPAVSKISAGNSSVEIGVVSGPTLFLYIPRMDDNYNQSLYGNLTGFAGYKVVKPKDLTVGTHIFSHPKVSISGTRSEAYMLIDQLQKGIIIK